MPKVSRTQLFGWAGKNPNNTGSLLQELSLLPGSEVMLHYNISVHDGLTNGARGIVHTFKFPGLPLGQLAVQSQVSPLAHKHQVIQPVEVPMPEVTERGPQMMERRQLTSEKIKFSQSHKM